MIKQNIFIAIMMGSTILFATNGDLMIGQGAKSRSMGGVGIAMSFGAESSLANPALLNSVDNMEVAGGFTYFTPDVSFGSNAGSNAMNGLDNPIAMQTSEFEPAIPIIPEIYFANRLTDALVYGVSMTGTAGMGVDYSTSTDNGAFAMQTSLSILKIAVPLSYTSSSYTFGFSPIFQYGMLQMNYLKGNPAPVEPDGSDAFIPSTNPESSSSGYGFELGLVTEIINGLTLGAVYKSAIEMEYEDNIASALTDFGISSITSGDKLEQPAESGLGLSFINTNNTIAVDYKQIAWGDALGYSDFGWENQSIFALGYEYNTDIFALRAGYNYANSPIVELDGSSMFNPDGLGYDNAGINFFNLAGFPAIIESHYTLGGGYVVSDALTLDLALIFTPEVTNSYNTTGLTQGMVYNMGGDPSSTQPSTADVTHSQMGFTVSVNYKF